MLACEYGRAQDRTYVSEYEHEGDMAVEGHGAG